MCPCALARAKSEPRRIGEYGSPVAKSNFALPAAGGSAGVRTGGIERAKASGKDFSGDADAGKPGYLHQQQWKGRAHRALRDAGATGYVRRKGARDRGTDDQERADDSRIGCKGCGGAALRGAGQASASAGRPARSKGGRQNGRGGPSFGGSGKSASRKRPAAEGTRGAAAPE